MAASHGPLVNWGDPSTPGRLWLHVTGAQYRGLGPGEADLAAELWDFARECGRGFTGPGLSLAGVGLLAAARRLAPRRAAVLGAIFAGGLGFGAVHPGLDREPFFLNAFWTLAVSAGLGAGALHGWLAARRPDRARAAGLVLAAAPLLPLLAHAPEQSRRSDYRAHDRALAALAVLPPDATLLVAGPLGYPPVYASLVEELRPDVRVVDLWLRIRSDGGGYGPELEALRRSPEPGDPTLRVAAAAAGWGRPVFLEPGVRERTWERIGLARVRGGALDRLVPSSAAAPPAASHAGPLVARFEGGWLLTGARLEPDRVERGDPVRIRLAWRRIGAPPEALPKVRLLAGTPEGSLLEDGAGRPLLRHQHAWGQGWPGAARASSLAESLVLVAPRALPLGPVALFLGLEGPEGPLATEGGKAFARIGELEIAPRRRPLWTLP